jgi:glycosyltransferase involved in cell wall biosynthesis
VPPADVPALTRAIRALATTSAEQRTAMGQRGRAYARTHLTKDVLVGRYEEILMRAARDRGRRAGRAASLV